MIINITRNYFFLGRGPPKNGKQMRSLSISFFYQTSRRFFGPKTLFSASFCVFLKWKMEMSAIFSLANEQWQPCLVLKKRTWSKTLLFELFCRECQLIKWDALKFSLELFVGWHEMRWAFLETKMNRLFRAEAGASEKVYSFFAWTKFCIHNVSMKYFLDPSPKSSVEEWCQVSSSIFLLCGFARKGESQPFSLTSKVL